MWLWEWKGEYWIQQSADPSTNQSNLCNGLPQLQLFEWMARCGEEERATDILITTITSYYSPDVFSMCVCNFLSLVNNQLFCSDPDRSGQVWMMVCRASQSRNAHTGVQDLFVQSPSKPKLSSALHAGALNLGISQCCALVLLGVEQYLPESVMDPVATKSIANESC